MTNRERAAKAAQALVAYDFELAREDEAAVSDLLCDLRHFCDEHELAFDICLFRAYDNYETEVMKESNERRYGTL